MLSDLAIFQTVKIPLIESGAAPSNRGIDAVIGKPALVRGYLTQVGAQVDGPPSFDVQARLHLYSRGETRTIDLSKTISAVSTEPDVINTLDFKIEGSLIQSDTMLSLEVLEPFGCRSQPQRGRLPRDGSVALLARDTGALRVVLVPVRYDADGSGRLPDTSAEQLERLRNSLAALYPVSSVEISVRAAVPTDMDLSGGSSSSAWTQLLDSLRALRAADGASDDVYYYGWVAPSGTFSGYCRSTCIAGLAFQAAANTPALRVGVGVGYAGEQMSMTMAHEVAHGHGRLHAPCGATAGLDSGYPHPDGVTETSGFDARTGQLVAETRKDMMSYCTPQWISGYTYQALLERSLQVNGRVTSEVAGGEQDWQVLIVGADGEARRGVPFPRFAPPAFAVREALDVLTNEGDHLGSYHAYRLPIADVDVAMVLHPPLPPGSHGIRFGGRNILLPSDGLRVP
jgi:hypothetical protein